MKTKPSTYILLVIIVLMSSAFAVSAGYKFLTAKTLPMIFSGSVLVLAVVELVREARGKKTASTKAAEEDTERSEAPLRRYMVEGAWIGGFFVALYLMGFVVSMPLFILSYLKSHGRRWSSSIITAVVTTVLCCGIFAYLLQVNLYPGLIYKLLVLR